MKTYTISLLCMTLLGGCVDKAPIGTVDFPYIRANSSKLQGKSISVEGYLAMAGPEDRGTNILEGSVFIYETMEDLSNSVGINGGILLNVTNYDVTSCNLLHVTATGQVIAEDRGRIFLEPTALSPTKGENARSCLVPLE